jgi:hypothetical protein
MPEFINHIPAAKFVAANVVGRIIGADNKDSHRAKDLTFTAPASSQIWGFLRFSDVGPGN